MTPTSLNYAAAAPCPAAIFHDDPGESHYAALPHIFSLHHVRHCRIISKMEIFTTKTYERAVRKVTTPDVRKAMETAIAADPTAGPVIPGTGGIRKLRWAGSGRGKRGGIRTIYFYHAAPHAAPEAIYLLTAYAKAAREDLSPADKKAWAKLVAAIKKEETRL